jgi:hypothetical protein
MSDNATELLPQSLRGKLIGGEKYTGAITAAGLLALLGYGAFKILPYLIVLLANTLYAGVLTIAVVALVYAAIKLRSTAQLWFALFVRKIHGQMVESDPYGMVRYIIMQGKLKIADAKEKMGRLRGSIQRIKASIDKNKADIESHAEIARAAEKQKNLPMRDMHTRLMGNIDKAVQKLVLQYNMLVGLGQTLQKGIENGELIIQEQEANVEIEIQTNQDLAIGKSAAEDVVAAINGDPERKELFQMAMTSIATSSARMYGQIEQMTIDLQPLMESIELGKIVDAEHGEKMLASYSDKVGLLAAPVTKIEVVQPVAVPVEVKSPNGATRYTR